MVGKVKSPPMPAVPHAPGVAEPFTDETVPETWCVWTRTVVAAATPPQSTAATVATVTTLAIRQPWNISRPSYP